MRIMEPFRVVPPSQKLNNYYHLQEERASNFTASLRPSILRPKCREFSGFHRPRLPDQRFPLASLPLLPPGPPCNYFLLFPEHVHFNASSRPFPFILQELLQWANSPSSFEIRYHDASFALLTEQRMTLNPDLTASTSQVLGLPMHRCTQLGDPSFQVTIQVLFASESLLEFHSGKRKSVLCPSGFPYKLTHETLRSFIESVSFQFKMVERT